MSPSDSFPGATASYPAPPVHPGDARSQYTQPAVRSSRLHMVERQVVTPPDLERVLSERSLRVAFQPVCSLQSREVIGYEALSRFPEQTVATPRQWFRPGVAARTLQALELLAATTALEQLARLPAHVFLAVNVSPATAASTESVSSRPRYRRNALSWTSPRTPPWTTTPLHRGDRSPALRSACGSPWTMPAPLTSACSTFSEFDPTS